jgi:hypothetical protein
MLEVVETNTLRTQEDKGSGRMLGRTKDVDKDVVSVGSGGDCRPFCSRVHSRSLRDLHIVSFEKSFGAEPFVLSPAVKKCEG